MSHTYRALAGLLLIGLLALVACANASAGARATGNGNGNGTGARSPTAMATPKPKPAGVPVITLTYCQGLMTITEANQFMQPQSPANTIRVDSSTSGGSCNYEYTQFHSVVTILFLPFHQGASLDTIVTQSLAQDQNQPGTQITKVPVSGVGDQALYIAASIATGGPTEYFYALDTTVNSLYISCFNSTVGVPPTNNLQPALTQVCRQVISRL